MAGPAGSEGAAGRIAAWMPDVELSLAYPGLHLREDVYATHGHYLDLHLTIPRLESIAASAMARMTGRGKAPGSAADYEAILGPLYAFYSGLAQAASPSSLARGGSLSRDVWRAASGNGRRPDADSRCAPRSRSRPASCSAGSRSPARWPR